jgi:hypothetical protein
LKTDGLIEKVAYTWFNRFCALCFMDVNRYTRIGVVSPAEGQSQPEILAEANPSLSVALHFLSKKGLISSKIA